MNLHDLINAHQHEEPEQAAKLVFDDLGCPQKWRDVFGGLLIDECRRQYRSGARSRERLIRSRGANGDARPTRHPPRGSGEVVNIDERRQFLADNICCGERGYIARGAMTVADHEARIAYLEKMRSGLTETIGWHREAIEAIKTAGVACLNEIEVAA